MALKDRDNQTPFDAHSGTSGEIEPILLCLDCGYDLRGHDGDPICCPECGGENTRADLSEASALTPEDSREFETEPTVASLCCGLVFVAIACFSSRFFVCGIMLFAGAGPLWLITIRNFASRHKYRAGWIDVMAWFHVSAATYVFFLFVIVVVAERLEVILERSTAMSLGGAVRVGITLILFALLGKRFDLSRWNPYHVARRKLAILVKRRTVEERKRLALEKRNLRDRH